eukprot:6936913-Pyramimonas_sp.AAC.1
MTAIIMRRRIFSLPFRDWCPLWVYSLSPSTIGAPVFFGWDLARTCKRSAPQSSNLDEESNPNTSTKKAIPIPRRRKQETGIRLGLVGLSYYTL